MGSPRWCPVRRDVAWWFVRCRCGAVGLSLGGPPARLVAWRDPLCQDRRRLQERGGSSLRAAPAVGSSPRESWSHADSRERRAACSGAAVSPLGASYRLDRPLQRAAPARAAAPATVINTPASAATHA